MIFEQYTRFAREQWELTMSESEHFSLDKCKGDEKTAIWDTMAPTYDLGLGTDNRRVDSTMERLKELGAFGTETIALDIGSGTGAYTLALAERCEAVYALDSSTGMQQVLKQKAEKQGIKNITPIYADWRTVPEDDLPCKFDIVLSSLNTGICDYDSLVKMNDVSRGFCCYAAPCGTAENPVRSDLQQIVFERKLRSAGGNDIIHAFNIIYGLGYRPELTYVPSEWTRKRVPEEAIDVFCRDFARYRDINGKTRQKIQDYVLSHLNDDGMFVQSQKATIGIMIWDSRSST